MAPVAVALCCRKRADLPDSPPTAHPGHITLQRLEPFQQGSVTLPGRVSWNPRLCASRRRTLFQGSLFSAYRYFSVSIGCLQAHVAEPSANNIHLDAGLQKMNRSAVPPEVGRYGLQTSVGPPLNNVRGIP